MQSQIAVCPTSQLIKEVSTFNIKAYINTHTKKWASFIVLERELNDTQSNEVTVTKAASAERTCKSRTHPVHATGVHAVCH